MLMTIIDGEADFADICFLIAIVVFAISAIARLVDKWEPTRGTLTDVGLFFGFLGFLVL
jgi:hypothetical protein